MKSFFSRYAVLFAVGVLLSLAVTGAEEEIARKKISVYFVGNSLIMSTTLDRVHSLFASRKIDLQFGSQLSGGKSLLRHWKYAEEPTQKWVCWETDKAHGETFLPNTAYFQQDPKNWRFGRYDTALAAHQWDALVLQSAPASIRDSMEAIPAFIDLGLKNKTVKEIFFFEAWPRRPKKAGTAVVGENQNEGVAEDIDYAAVWLADYTATVADTDETAANGVPSRSYTKKLFELLREKYPDLGARLRVIPIGEVLFVLDAKIKEGKLPGLEELAQRTPSKLPGLRAGTSFAQGVNILYADIVHFNPMPHKAGVLGNFISGTTLFAVLSGETPVGLDASIYGLDNQKDADLLLGHPIGSPKAACARHAATFCRCLAS